MGSRALPPWNQSEADIKRKLTVERKLVLVAVPNEELVGTAIYGYGGHRGGGRCRRGG